MRHHMILKAPRFSSFAVRHRNVPRPEGTMTVTHNGRQYTFKRCAMNDNEWRLTSITNPREQVTLNRWQMHVAGLLAQVEGKK